MAKNLLSTILLLLVSFISSAVWGQNSGLSPEFHKIKRKELREKMPTNSVAVFFSSPVRNRANDVDYIYHPDPNFYYLSGWEEPHAVLLIYKSPQQDDAGIYLDKIYVRERNAYREMWDGRRKGIAGASTMGYDRVAERSLFKNDAHHFETFDKVLFFNFENDVKDFKNDSNDLFDLQQTFKDKINFPQNFDGQRYELYSQIRDVAPEDADELKDQLGYYLRQDQSLKEDPIIKSFLEEKENLSVELQKKADLEVAPFNYDLKVLKRYMAELREIKTQIEVSLIRKAVRISAHGQREVMKALHAEMTEREVQGIHQYVFKKYGAAHEGYPSIVGAGHNGCVLHYITNDKENINNQLILMDLGAEYKGYTADVTRTVPVTGKFTQPQKELYKIVYASQQAGIKAAQVGADFKEIREACYEVVKNGLLELGLIDKPEDFRRYLPHGVAHHIGLDVHDPGLYEKLAENMIITVEPGIYVPKDSPCDPKYWDIGIRIEDDVLITKEGPITLSDEAPRKWDEIEALMAESSPLDNFVLPEIED